MFNNFEYHSWYLRQISLQIILLPILIQITRLRNKRALIVRIEGDIVFRGKIDAETRAYVRFLVKFYFYMCTQKNLDEVKISLPDSCIPNVPQASNPLHQQDSVAVLVNKLRSKDVTGPQIICEMMELNYSEVNYFHKICANEQVELIEDKRFFQIIGNWEAPLPLTTDKVNLPDNREQCLRRLLSLKRKLCNDERARENYIAFMHLSMLCRRGRRGMGWGFDCLCWPWGRVFDWPCSPRGGDIWIFLRPTWRYLTADSDEKDWDRTYVSRFHASRMRRTVWKDLEIMEANENKRKLSGFHCFVFKFLF